MNEKRFNTLCNPLLHYSSTIYIMMLYSLLITKIQVILKEVNIQHKGTMRDGSSNRNQSVLSRLLINRDGCFHHFFLQHYLWYYFLQQLLPTPHTLRTLNHLHHLRNRQNVFHDGDPQHHHTSFDPHSALPTCFRQDP